MSAHIDILRFVEQIQQTVQRAVSEGIFGMEKSLLSMRYLSLGLLLLLSVPVIASAQNNSQSFTLFEPVEAQQSSENRNFPQVARPAQAATATSPIFTLVGTSRIGDRRSAIVKHSSGNEVMVPLREFGVTPIPGYESFAVVGADAGNLSIRYPGGTACTEFRDAGVSCSGEGNVAVLSLTTADPIAVRETPEQRIQRLQGQLQEEAQALQQDSTATAMPVDENRNPFAILRERARNGDAQIADPNGTTRQFRPRRIDPSDVPPGYRVVSTPFGDRLVEQ